MDPLQNRTCCRAITIFQLYFTQVWPTSVAKLWMSMHSQLQQWYVRVRRASTENMEPLTILVLYLQGSDAGQKWLKISRIFNFDVPLWMTRIGQTLYLHRIVALSYRNRSWRFQPCIYKSFGGLAVWWTPFRIGHVAAQLPYFNYISPKFDRLVWLSYECPCILSYSNGMYGYVEQAQKIWSL